VRHFLCVAGCYRARRVVAFSILSRCSFSAAIDLWLLYFISVRVHARACILGVGCTYLHIFVIFRVGEIESRFRPQLARFGLQRASASALLVSIFHFHAAALCAALYGQDTRCHYAARCTR